MRDRKSVEKRLAELRDLLPRVEGTPTEVYSRIVGYYRSVRNWNAGKREEYGARLAYRMPDVPAPTVGYAAAVGDAAQSVAGLEAEPDRVAQRATTRVERGQTAHIAGEVLVFTRETCPNCPPVANYVVRSGMQARFVNVDLDDGLELARELGVMATPTVVGFDGAGHESFRAFDVEGLRSTLEC